MHRAKVNVLLNISGISSLICSPVGQISIDSREKYKKNFHVIKNLDVEALGFE